jgi:hypothetical protein
LETEKRNIGFEVRRLLLEENQMRQRDDGREESTRGDGFKLIDEKARACYKSLGE